jgi:hypothetical protein
MNSELIETVETAMVDHITQFIRREWQPGRLDHTGGVLDTAEKHWGASQHEGASRIEEELTECLSDVTHASPENANKDRSRCKREMTYIQTVTSCREGLLGIMICAALPTIVSNHL